MPVLQINTFRRQFAEKQNSIHSWNSPENFEKYVMLTTEENHIEEKIHFLEKLYLMVFKSKELTWNDINDGFPTTPSKFWKHENTKAKH